MINLIIINIPFFLNFISLWLNLELLSTNLVRKIIHENILHVYFYKLITATM